MSATAQQKINIARKLSRLLADNNITAFLDKDESLAVAEDAYNWVEANVPSSYNDALLLVFRNNASVKLKAELLKAAVEELAKAN